MSAVNVAFSCKSIEAVPGEETVTVRVLPLPPFVPKANTVPVGRTFVNVLAVDPVACVLVRVNDVALVIDAICFVKLLTLIKSPTLTCDVKDVPLPVTVFDHAPIVTVPVKAEDSTLAPALLTTTM